MKRSRIKSSINDSHIEILEEQHAIEAKKIFREKANNRDPHLYRHANQDRLKFWEE